MSNTIDAKRETTIKTRYVAGSQQLLRADRETVSEVSPAIADDIARVVAAAIGDCGVLVLSDYAKGVLTPPSITAMIAAAHRAGKPILVDPKGHDYTRYRGATLLTPNRRELAEAVHAPVGDDAQIAAACRKLIKLCGTEAVLCTRGADGMTLVTAKGKVHQIGRAHV